VDGDGAPRQAPRAKGLPERLVLWRHLLRNACLPMITLTMAGPRIKLA
jgi:ABC-type dipeptide/oligopeptide/nickel transport system permease component